MSKHTPGPWNVSERGSIEFEDGFVGEAYEYDPKNDDELPMMANARLMAAAPELLYMVQQLSDRLPRTYDDDQRLYLQAKELIAKLNGRVYRRE